MRAQCATRCDICTEAHYRASSGGYQCANQRTQTRRHRTRDRAYFGAHYGGRAGIRANRGLKRGRPTRRHVAHWPAR